MDGSRYLKESSGNCEQSPSTTLEAGSRLVCTHEDSFVILNTGATANLVRFRWLAHRSSLLGNMCLPRVTTYPAWARFKFGDGRMGDVRFAADITAGTAGARGNFAASALDADSTAFVLERGVGGPRRPAGFFSRNPHVGLKEVETPPASQ